LANEDSRGGRLFSVEFLRHNDTITFEVMKIKAKNKRKQLNIREMAIVVACHAAD
jgi:hypothetical protein